MVFEFEDMTKEELEQEIKEFKEELEDDKLKTEEKSEDNEKIKVYIDVITMQDIYILKTKTFYTNDKPILMDKEEFDKYQKNSVKWGKFQDGIKSLIDEYDIDL